MGDSISSGPIQNRPYRSHRVPACTRCRTRKIRCIIDVPGQPCFSCRERRLKCLYSDQSPEEKPSEEGPEKRRRLTTSNITDQEGDHSLAKAFANGGTAPAKEQSSILVGPAVAEDVEILQRAISKHDSASGLRLDPYRLLSREAGNPVIYLSVPRHRSGLPSSVDAGKGPLEIVSQVLGPFKNEVIDLYFKHIHPNYPVLDEPTCNLLKHHQVDKIPSALLTTIYVIAAPYWRLSDTLKLHPHPDYHYLWNKSINALLEDYLSPSISTIGNAVLEMVGRPSVSIVGNINNCGRAVALAETFGLHRDPSRWKIGAEEKTTRIRLWWGILINDYWASIAYGTPPHLAKGYYDVPLPTLDSLLPRKATPSQKVSLICYLHLCHLTELMGDALPLVYQLKPSPQEMMHAIARLEHRLDQLRAQLPEWLPYPNQPGSSNLWFCFLYVKLLITRLSLRAIVLDTNESDASPSYDQLRDVSKASSDVLDFVNALGECQFQDFWFPYSAHLLVLATMVFLRCAVEAPENERNAYVTRLQRLISHIQHARDTYDWDIADFCLERCSGPVAKIAALASRDPIPPPPVDSGAFGVSDNGQASGASPRFDDPAFYMGEFMDSSTTFDFSWEALWDTPSLISGFPS